jgi:trans-aconitate methyltransferase
MAGEHQRQRVRTDERSRGSVVYDKHRLVRRRRRHLDLRTGDRRSLPADWDAKTYERVSDPQFEWGRKVLARLALRGDETVLDAGCGAGRLTELLAERLPHGRLVALDSSRPMLELARTRLERFGDRVTYVFADAAQYIQRPPADAYFSTATFHWVPDHDTLFTAIAAGLRPGGQLVSQCGGGANLFRFRERSAALRGAPPFAPYLRDFVEPWHHAMPDETLERLERAGFVDVRAWLEAEPVRFADASAYVEFVTAVLLRDELARLPGEDLRREYVHALVEQAGRDDPPFELDYWRLNADATRG